MSEDKINSWLPKQGTWLGRVVDVCWDYDTSNTMRGLIVREDEDSPGLMIIKLNNGDYITSKECQYSLIKEEA